MTKYIPTYLDNHTYLYLPPIIPNGFDLHSTGNPSVEIKVTFTINMNITTEKLVWQTLENSFFISLINFQSAVVSI